MSSRKRLAILVGIGLFLIASAGAYIEFHFDLRAGTGPAGPAVPEDPNERGYDAIRRVFLNTILAERDVIAGSQPRQ